MAEDFNEGVEDILSAYADVLNEQTSDEHIRESTAFGTVPTGVYKLIVAKKELRAAYKPRPDGSVPPQRLRAHLQITVVDKESGKRLGTVFTDASPQIRRYENGGMDSQARLWGQFAQIHEAKQRSLTVKQIFEEVGAFPYQGQVKELFRVPQPDGREKLQAPAGDEQTKEWREAGYSAMNVVNSVQALKAA